MKRTKNRSRFERIPEDSGRGSAWKDSYPGIGQYELIMPEVEAFKFSFYPVFRMPEGTFEVYGESPALSAALEQGLMKTFYAVPLTEESMKQMATYIQGFMDCHYWKELSNDRE